MTTFEEWKDDYGLVYEPNYSEATEADCKAAFNAGAASQAMAIAAKDAEIAELVAAITWYLKENDTDGFGCTCEPDRMCSPCQTNMRQQVLRAALAKARKP